jgi:hypothetical protein
MSRSAEPTSPQEHLRRVLERLGEHQERRQGVYFARCPAHDDHNPSLELTVKDGKFVMICRVGCRNEAILKALGTTWREILGGDATANGNGHAPRAKGRIAKKPRGRILSTYDYKDEEGQLLFQTVRYDPKDFSQRRPDHERPGEWIENLKGVRRVLYRLPELLRAPAGKWRCIVEGEKDVDNLVRLGIVATTNPMGAPKWKPVDPEVVRRALGDHRVALFPDNDEIGRRHVQDVATRLKGIAAEVRIVELPGLPEKGDVSDWLAAGGTIEQLRELIGQAPVWTPSLNTADPQCPVASHGQKAKDIILAHFREMLDPTFRHGEFIYSRTHGRDIRRAEVCSAANSRLIEALAHAVDCPKERKSGEVDESAIPRLFKTWSGTAWEDLIGALPEEHESDEIVDPAQEQFRRLVATAMYRMVSLGRVRKATRQAEVDETQVENRSLIDWCIQFAKPGRWAKVRYSVWTRRPEGTTIPQVAITVGLFAELRVVELARMGQRQFANLCRMYGVGIDRECRAGSRALELAPEFVSELLAEPTQVDEGEANFAETSRARENGDSPSCSRELGEPPRFSDDGEPDGRHDGPPSVRFSVNSDLTDDMTDPLPSGSPSASTSR